MIADIQRSVAAHFGLTVGMLTGPRRARAIARPRQMAMYLASVKTNKSLPQIGRAFRRDHTTVMHGIRVIERLRASDAGFAAELAAISLECGNSICEESIAIDLEGIVEEISHLIRRHLQRNPASLIALLKTGRSLE